MKVDLLHTFSWDETNDLLQAEFVAARAKFNGSLRCYFGLSQAVFEMAFGTALLFSHKKGMGLISGDSWVFEGVMPHLYKEGFQVQEERRHRLDVAAFVGALKKETSFVLWSEDHPILGTCDHQKNEELDQALNDKKIFSIRVSHAAYRHHAVEMRPYSARLCSLTPNLALAVVGDRVRVTPLVAHRMAWQPQETLATVKFHLRDHQHSAELVSTFEQQCRQKTGFQPYLTTAERLYDRAVIHHPEINAEAVLQILKGQLGSPLAAPMQEWDAEIVNACRWKPAPALRSWWEPLPSEEVLRGLLILSVSVLAKTQILTWLAEGEAAARINQKN
jgi:hypothetical protein